MMPHGELLVNGHFLGGPCDTSYGKDVIGSPWNEHVVGTVAEGTWNDLNTALDCAEDAASLWKSSPVQSRAELLNRISKEIGLRKEELSELLSKEVGKPISIARGEVDRTALTFLFAAEEALKIRPEQIIPAQDARFEGATIEVFRAPLGVILGFVPYNWPLNLAAHKLAPAIASGNAIVLKVSPQAPLSTLALVRILHECGCPHGIVNAWNGPNKDAERAVKDRRVDMLSFTGSAQVGWYLQSLVPGRPFTLELGGTATCVILPDSDLLSAAQKIVTSAFAFAGQVCISAQHVLCHQSVYDECSKILCKLTEETLGGNPAKVDTVCGPMIDQASKTRVQAWIQAAIDTGATTLAVGDHSPELECPNYLPPTLLENVPLDCNLWKEEAFGPVLTLRSIANLSEAVDLISQSKYGLQHSIFTLDEAAIQIFTDQVQAGAVIINDSPSLRYDNAPYGGTKFSGFGREGISAAMLSMTEQKVRISRPSKY